MFDSLAHTTLFFQLLFGDLLYVACTFVKSFGGVICYIWVVFITYSCHVPNTYFIKCSFETWVKGHSKFYNHWNMSQGQPLKQI
jgi:hypothetical protein